MFKLPICFYIWQLIAWRKEGNLVNIRFKIIIIRLCGSWYLYRLSTQIKRNFARRCAISSTSLSLHKNTIFIYISILSSKLLLFARLGWFGRWSCTAGAAGQISKYNLYLLLFIICIDNPQLIIIFCTTWVVWEVELHCRSCWADPGQGRPRTCRNIVTASDWGIQRRHISRHTRSHITSSLSG